MTLTKNATLNWNVAFHWKAIFTWKTTLNYKATSSEGNIEPKIDFEQQKQPFKKEPAL